MIYCCAVIYYRLVDEGHKVFGVEISDMAVRELFKDADLSPTLTTVESNFTLYEVGRELHEVLESS